MGCDKCDDLKEELKDLKDEFKDYKKMADGIEKDLEKQIKSLEKENEKLLGKLNDAQERAEKKTLEARKAEADLRVAEQARDDFKKQITKLQQKITELEVENEGALNSKRNNDAAIEELTYRSQVLEEKVVLLAIEKQELKEREAEEIETMRSRMAEAEEEISILRLRNERAGSGFNSAKDTKDAPGHKFFSVNNFDNRDINRNHPSGQKGITQNITIFRQRNFIRGDVISTENISRPEISSFNSPHKENGPNTTHDDDKDPISINELGGLEDINEELKMSDVELDQSMEKHIDHSENEDKLNTEKENLTNQKEQPKEETKEVTDAFIEKNTTEVKSSLLYEEPQKNDIESQCLATNSNEPTVAVIEKKESQQDKNLEDPSSIIEKTQNLNDQQHTQNSIKEKEEDHAHLSSGNEFTIPEISQKEVDRE